MPALWADLGLARETVDRAEEKGLLTGREALAGQSLADRLAETAVLTISEPLVFKTRAIYQAAAVHT